MINSMNPEKYKYLKVFLSILLVCINGLIGFFYWFTFRQLVIHILANSSINIWAWRFVDMVTFMLYGVIWLVSIHILQHFYEKEFKKRWVPRIFIGVTVIQILLLGVSNLVIRVIGS